ncbi:phospholipase/carboxylesterase [Andreprevotia lacus DSM 23236]|jgi:phospholipase/carboxylesterase|uniref:Phospholipase/carboxylesterase n=1 Tax=Andreprevotia lacus DSM 23236 TaxID=1121001 RepID=A0A1W1XP55_9NEIS|nr:alpha/beta hydrolase [Andreprevotia lacus]SMC25301.1 phospholipase/carboxylesterase [Andreprevotia lacus DSM 23236]
MSDLLPYEEVSTGAKPTASVIWLHGLGADGSDFVPVVPELGLPDDLAVRFIFPHAPHMPITCNNGYVMRAWYDIVFFDQINRHADRAGVLASVAQIRALIAAENARGIPSSHIVLAGFSQGGAIAYTAGLTHPEPLAGIIALSTYIPAPELLEGDALAANHATPVFAGHGTADPVVPMLLGQQAMETVQRLGNPLSWHTYPMPHSVCLPEIQHIGAFLAKQLA